MPKTTPVELSGQVEPLESGVLSPVRRILPRSLFARSLLILLTPVILAQLVAAYMFYDRHWDSIAARLSTAIANEISLLVESAETIADPEIASLELSAIARRLDLTATLDPVARIPDRRSVPPGLLESALAEALDSRVMRPFVIEPRQPPQRIQLSVGLMTTGVLRVQIPERRLFSPTTYIFILWMSGSAIVLIGVAIVFMRNQIRPIRRLADIADRYGKGLDAEDLRLEGATEVRKAAVAFLRMRARLQTQVRQRTEMLAAVSHDLRTPLTRMKLHLAMLGDGPDIEELRRDVVEMEAMVEGYLAFARGEGEEAARPIDLSMLLTELVTDARREGARIDAHIADDLHIDGRPSALKRGIANLLANARRYAHACTLGAQRIGPIIEVVIDDDGPGIPEHLREDVFRPFFRLDSSRNQDQAGTGLGLAIARDMIRGHGGDILLSESPLGGVRATIWLPR